MLINKFFRHSRGYDTKSIILIVSISILILSYFTFNLQCERHFNLHNVPSSYITGNFNRSEPIIFVGLYTFIITSHLKNLLRSYEFFQEVFQDQVRR